ncbi:f7bdd25d-a8f9-4e02-84ee-ff7478204032 [Sclerotinia trifoliorum]|uniref:F7bdd25d-a8f9-4e02-84ee-ff7478204032 n=1 Tax=Sclerotinia trifoliorum TaxID=28548 RepID=A0A8H2ZV89_9HELO|nr:f7bdd25d-a8f9-4e02-84ee-ff7478204032 [Sclerotinia trifoliorum]
MMRNKQSSSLQKTYDECYLICSTAVYFEGQGNEAEALRSWRSALDQIYYHNAYRVPAGYVPKSETEKALKDSLRSMEMQCKERVDLLEALKASREEKESGEKTPPDETSSGGSGSGRFKSFLKSGRASSDSLPHTTSNTSNTIGEGTIPAVNYDGLPKPTPPPLPQRPSLAAKNSSEMAVVGGERSMSSSSIAPQSASSKPSAPTFHPSIPAPQHKMSKDSRSPSPEKGGRTMLQTLRSGDSKKSKSSRSSQKKGDNSVTNKAATLAWNTMGRKGKDKDRSIRSQDPETDNSTTNLPGTKPGFSDPTKGKPLPPNPVRFDSTTRTLVPEARPPRKSPVDLLTGMNDLVGATGRSNGYPFPLTDPGQPGAVSGHSLNAATMKDLINLDSPLVPPPAEPDTGPSSQPSSIESSATTFAQLKKGPPPPPPHSRPPGKFEPLKYPTYLQEYPDTIAKKGNPDGILLQRRRPSPRLVSDADSTATSNRLQRKPVSANISSTRRVDDGRRSRGKEVRRVKGDDTSSQSANDDTSNEEPRTRHKRKQKQVLAPILADPTTPTSDESNDSAADTIRSAWDEKVKYLMKHLPKGVDEGAAKQIFNEIVVQGDEVHWEDVAGLEAAKNALKEAVVYPFLRPDLFMGLREPARGMLLFGPPGTGKTMLARAVATESKSTFFSISASSLTSKFLGESEKLVRALFSLAKALAPSIIFVDEIDSLLSARSGGEHEATRRIKTEFLIQWSDLQRAAAGREQTDKEKERGDASRVLVLAATNLPWAIDEAARRRFVRRQYIPLPEDETRGKQLKTLLGHQKHSLKDKGIEELVRLTDGFSGSDITALAKDAAMGPLRSLGEKLLEMSMDDIRPMQMEDFEASLVNIRPSVSKQGLQEFEDWAKEFGERGG